MTYLNKEQKLWEVPNLPKLYRITNKTNGKIYIGVTRQKMSDRWRGHRSGASNCIHLKHAVSKYGAANFKFEVLAVGHENYIFELEQKAIVLFNSLDREVGYNLKIKAKPPAAQTKTHKERISESLKKFYQNNPSKNKGKPSHKREKVTINGVEYPSIKQACKTVGINYKTFLKIRSENLLHDTNEYFRLSKIKQYKPRATKKIRKSKSEAKTGENNPMFGKLNNHRSKKVEILGIMYPSISEAVRQTNMTKSMIEKRLQKGISGYKYVEDKLI